MVSVFIKRIVGLGLILILTTQSACAQSRELTVKEGDHPLFVLLDFWSLNVPPHIVENSRIDLYNALVGKKPSHPDAVLIEDIGPLPLVDGERPSVSALGLDGYLKALAVHSGAEFSVYGELVHSNEGLFLFLVLRDTATGEYSRHWQTRYADEADLIGQIELIAAGLRYAATHPDSQLDNETNQDDVSRSIGVFATFPTNLGIEQGLVFDSFSLAGGIGFEYVDYYGLNALFPSMIASQIGFSGGLAYAVNAAPKFGDSNRLMAHAQVLLPPAIGIDFFALGAVYELPLSGGTGSAFARGAVGITMTPYVMSSLYWDPATFEIFPIRMMYDLGSHKWHVTVDLVRAMLGHVKQHPSRWSN